MRILVVEDDIGSRDLLCNILSRYDSCTSAFDGNEAIEEFVKGWVNGYPYDVMFIDLMIPGMNGIDVIDKIREIESTTKISKDERIKIVVTTAYDSEFRSVILNMGCEGYLVKPINKDDVFNFLKEFNLM
jgi:two-component system chemotaxis response regulator CheY